jgi:predicted ATP-dependent endonuclease of OLD family
MKYSKFFIKNFKGINELEINLDKIPSGKIFPLVGLNESGKTTILEAINLFQNRFKEGEEHKMIHKNEQGVFEDEIFVEATLKLDDIDKKIINSELKNQKLEIEKPLEIIKITKKYIFDGVDLKEKGYEEIFDFDLNVKSKRAQNFTNLNSKDNELYEKIKEKIIGLIPKILYFENFIFDFPEKIYLEKLDNSYITKTETQEEYRNISQDILSSINIKYNLQKHILNRIKSTNESGKQALKQILNEMAQKLNSTIVKSWQDIFPTSSPKSLEIIYDKDEDGCYLQFKIKEGASFDINEMSLGFRWFFGFLLFTEFRKKRKGEDGEYLFLFDEPASNLHPKSQKKLLKLFDKLTTHSKIIYSTHSHYLLNPKFLLSSFVVKDEGIKEKDSGNIDLENYKQDIKAEYYKTFIGNSKNQETHFQPILNCLDYIKNPFTPSQKIVFVEGKYDYYTFKWIKELLSLNLDFNFYPGGDQKYPKIFREYIANNKKFIVIFDSDKAGKKERKNCIEKVSIELEKIIFTLEDIDSNFIKFQTEKLFPKQERIAIQKLYFPSDENYNKPYFNFAIQQLFIEKKSYPLSDETKENFKKIFEFIKIKLEELENGTN